MQDIATVSSLLGNFNRVSLVTILVMVLHSYLLNSFLFVANESTHKRVIFYTVGEYLLLAAVSALQVVYIRRLFSKSVAYNRV